MSAASGIVAVDGALLSELLSIATQALRGKRRLLGRLAAREGIDSHDALEELGAFPDSACTALDDSAGLRPALCTAGRGCAVADECSLATSGDSRLIALSATASLVRRLALSWSRPFESSPVRSLSDLAYPVAQLLERSGCAGQDTPPRARTSLALIDMAARRGGPLGALDAFLTQQEVEQVAAFIPPGSGRGDDALLRIEGWLRRAATLEVALVESTSRESRR